jgi:hypothetical protein
MVSKLHFVHAINTGNSCPVVISKNGILSFVKLRAGMSRNLGILSEWFACAVGCCHAQY